MVYPEDVPQGTCSKHVDFHFCVDGGGVATEYCSLFGDANIQTRSLVKLTQAEINEIRDAARVGLVDTYLDNGYVYFVDGSGDGMGWTGFYGGLSGDAPYCTCQLHNEDTWGDFEGIPGLDEDWTQEDGFGPGHQEDDGGEDDGGAWG